MWTCQLHMFPLYSSIGIDFGLSNVMYASKFDTLSNAELILSILAVFHVNIDFLHRKSGLFDLKAKKYNISCKKSMNL